MIKNGVYAAGLSILNSDKSLDINSQSITLSLRLKRVYTVYFFLDQQDKANYYLFQKKKILFLKQPPVSLKINFILELVSIL